MFKEKIVDSLRKAAENKIDPKPNLETTSRFSPASLAQINSTLSELRGKYEPDFVSAVEKWLLNLETEAIKYLAIKGYFDPVKDNSSPIDQLRMASLIQKTGVPFGLASWWSRSDQPKLYPELLAELAQILPPRFPVQMVDKIFKNNDLSKSSEPLIKAFGHFLVGDFLYSEKNNLDYGIISKIIANVVQANYPENRIAQGGVSQTLYKKLEDLGVQEKIRGELVKIDQELKYFISQVDQTNSLAVQQISKIVSALSLYFINQISVILLEGSEPDLQDLQEKTLLIKPTKSGSIRNFISSAKTTLSKPISKVFSASSIEESESNTIFSDKERVALMSPSLEFRLFDNKELESFLTIRLKEEGKSDAVIKSIIDAAGLELVEVGASPFFVPFFSLITMINPPLGLALSVSAPLLNGPTSTFYFLSFIGYLADKNDGFAKLLDGTSLGIEARSAVAIVKGYRNYQTRELSGIATRYGLIATSLAK